ncbi:cysteine synthase [Stachybotrys elegans]|uniref:Cysteine synthase n=1 Tax=Stachybotrys elegans TaxID=80388 RepID=A0A8K0SZM4_9HYPO|nr:cysteine synthase [Stachybotrys elegans]
MTHNNVFKGSDAVAQFFNPDNNPPMPLVELPDVLNPFRRDGVRIYAKMLTMLPAQNVKSLPALNMLLDKAPGAATQSIVEASSGSTVLSLGIISNVLWGNDDVTAYVTNKKHKDSLKLLRFFGLKVSLYGGLAQQEPTDPKGIMERLRQLAKEDDSICYPGQYDNENNWRAHERWTGPQILQQLPEVNVFCTTVGTGGCITGTGAYLKAEKPSVKVLGIFNVFGDPTPGPRHLHGFKTCGFPWKQTVDTYREVTSAASYRMSMRLSRQGLIAGPSSGEALQGLLDYLGDLKATDKLSELADATTGEISCVFTCSDLPYQYLDGYFTKLSEEEFPPILNDVLLSCDQERHDERWILDAKHALRVIAGEELLSSSPDSTSENPVKAANVWCSRCRMPSTANSSTSLRQSIKRIFCRGGTGEAADVRRSPYKQCGHMSNNSAPMILDLRRTGSYTDGHARGSYSLPLPELETGGDLFGNAQAVHQAWTSVRAALEQPGVGDLLGQGQIKHNKEVLVLCEDGDVSRLATAMLRSRGVAASSVEGGFSGLKAAV